MNTNIQQKMSTAWEARKEAIWNTWDNLYPRPCPFPSDDEKIGFSAGFTACHDLLMPLLIEALPYVMDSFCWNEVSDTDLVKRMKELIDGA